MATLNLEPMTNGTLWDDPNYTYGEGLDAPATYDNWCNTGSWFEFTTPLEQASIMGYVSVKVTVSNIVKQSTAYDCSGQVAVRLTFDPLTTDQTVFGNDYYATIAKFGWKEVDNVLTYYDHKFNDGVTFNTEYSSGFGVNGLIPGEKYRVYLQTRKVRDDPELTFDVTVDSTVMEYGYIETVVYS